MLGSWRNRIVSCARFLRQGFAASSLLVLLAWEGAAHSQPAAPPVPLALEGDSARGEVLAFTCFGCHGVPGSRNAYPSFHVPKLGGQNADYLEIALQGYRNGSRRHPTMQAQAATLADQDIADIAAYFASLEGEPETGVSDASLEVIRAGQQKSVACVPCHGNEGVAEGPQWPNLAGQHASYLRHALEQYKSGARADLLMGPMTSALDDEVLAELAAFYAELPGLHGTER
jgi:cytochrome c553